MAKVSPIQSNFNGGELSPVALGRVDQERWRTSLEIMQNYVGQISGGATRRPGTYFVQATKDSTRKSILLPFIFSTGQGTVLEFGHQYVRFYTAEAPVLSAGVPYEIVSPYSESDLPLLRISQSADVIYIAHPSYAPRKLVRSGLTSWAFSTVSFLDGPYLPVNSTSTTLTPSAATGTGVTLTASSTTGINGGAGFQTSDVGRIIRIRQGSNPWGWVTITGHTSTTVVTVTVNSTLTGTVASAVWRLGAWSATSGYPNDNTFHEDRLWWGGGAATPQTVYSSVSGDYENMQPTALDASATVTADKALTITINSGRVDPIRWLRGDERGLLVGTAGGEWTIRPAQTSEALSATGLPVARQASNFGSDTAAPLRVSKAILFPTRTGRKLREMAYVLEVDGFRSPDMTIVATHALLGGIYQMAFQQEPYNVAWIARKDGGLWGMTYDREQNIVGWHRHVLGGVSDANNAPALVESVCVIPSSDGTYDQLWLIVNRRINGATSRTVEYMGRFNEAYGTADQCYFVDCGVRQTGSASTITGLTHLEGQTVSVLVDGKPHPPKTVSSGQITLDYAGSVRVAGLGFTSRCKALRPEAGAEDGTAQGKTKRIHRVTFRFHESIGLDVGRDFDNLQSLTFNTSSDVMDQALPLFSGDMSVEWEGNYDTDGYICWQQTQPLPSTLLALMPQMVTQDRG